jgi:heat shock protein HtpX
MDYSRIARHKLLNFFQSLALVLLLAALMSYVAYIIAGDVLAWLTFLMVIVVYIANPMIAPNLILRMYRAQPIGIDEAPGLYRLVALIAKRAELEHSPSLFYVPSNVLNAFAVGHSGNSVIAVSAGLLQRLSYEELAGILAHEITHIKNNDLRVMTFADIAGRMTKILSMLGQLLILINLPLILFTDIRFNWVPLLILVFAPLLSDLVQLGLSRIREYDADLGSAILLGDARPLASALEKLEHYEHNFLGGVFVPVQKIPDPSLLRTHPRLEERIKRLLDFHRQQELQPIIGDAVPHDSREIPIHRISPRDARRHFTGFWY